MSLPPEPRPAPVARWVRPRIHDRFRVEASVAEDDGAEVLMQVLVRSAKARLFELCVIQRELEDLIRSRWDEVEREMGARLAEIEETRAAERRLQESEAKESRIHAEKEGRSSGFREGFAKGREEGYRLGFEEGRQEGEKLGREEGGRAQREELESAARALRTACAAVIEREGQILAEARVHLLELARAVAERILRRELALDRTAAQRVVEGAIDLVVRRGRLTITVHPEDARAIEEAVTASPAWTEGFEGVDVRAAPSLQRGGCRLQCGEGSVDMTLETQLDQIFDAVEAAWDRRDGLDAPRPVAKGADRTLPLTRSTEGAS